MPLLALVVDDEQSIRDLVEVTLQMEGYLTLTAPDGQTALQLAEQYRPDVITLDIMMPGMTGWEVADALSRNPGTSRIPIVVVSGKPLVDLVNHRSRHLATAVLSKPFDLATFVDVVASSITPVLPLQRAPQTHVQRDRV